MENVIKDYLNTIEPLITTFATIKTVDVVNMLKKIDEYHESELKKLRVGDVSICTCGTEEYSENEPRSNGMTYCGKCDRPY